MATIDVPLAISLHPKMALFDYDRIGFYKVDFGISSYEEFAKAVAELKERPRDNKKQIEELKLELDKLLKDSIKVEEKLSNNSDMQSYMKFLEKSYFKQNELEEKIKILEWESLNSYITTREETRAIMAEIRKDIYNATKEVVLENKYLLVLNTSIAVPYKFALNYVDLIYSQGIPGVNFCLFYAFLYYTDLKKPEFKESDQIKVEKWHKLTKKTKDVFPITNYPLVLAGGQSITSKVLKKIYDKYKVDKSLFEIIDNSISRIECLQFGKPIEKLVIVGEK